MAANKDEMSCWSLLTMVCLRLPALGLWLMLVYWIMARLAAPPAWWAAFCAYCVLSIAAFAVTVTIEVLKKGR